MTKLAKLEPAPAPPTVHDDANAVLSMIDRVLSNPDIPVERLEQLFNLHQRVQADNAKRAYYAALANLQAKLPAVARKGKGHNDKMYARFEDIMDAIRAPLAEFGFSISFRTDQPDGKLSVTGVLAHLAGHHEETTLVLPQDTTGGKNAVQAWGSSSSYGKRYALVTLLGIATQDDDDGKAAAGSSPITEAQFVEIADLIRETSTPLEKVLEFHGIESLSDMPSKDYAAARARLMAKKQARAK
jgi:hypothetical protein